MIAVDLAGTDFYIWCVEEPELCKEFLSKITQGLIEAEEYARKIDPRPNAYDAYGLAEDSSTIMSPEMFREFVAPYDKILYSRFGKQIRGMHMCGPSLHLHEVLVNDLAITAFDVFGYQVKPWDIARTMGGKVHLWGNINPMLMLSGSREEVYREVMMTLEHLGPVGGFMLGDGANVCPNTPLENINALVEASEEYAASHPELFTAV
jgi:uroporphyrinogen-III decarboxylase